MRERRPRRRLLQESWRVRFKGFPASPHAESNREEDETCRAAADFATIKCGRRIANSTRTANEPR